jgi:hypothetical protein
MGRKRNENIAPMLNTHQGNLKDGLMGNEFVKITPFLKHLIAYKIFYGSTF